MVKDQNEEQNYELSLSVDTLQQLPLPQLRYWPHRDAEAMSKFTKNEDTN